jgi:hypothetical protein
VADADSRGREPLAGDRPEDDQPDPEALLREALGKFKDLALVTAGTKIGKEIGNPERPAHARIS